MSHTDKRLEKAYENALCIPIHMGSRIVLMSDCHRGVGNWGDNFQANQNLFFAALQYYNRRNFIYIELGDGDELWENRDLREIIRIHSNQFWMMSEFYRDCRFYMLYGKTPLRRNLRRLRCIGMRPSFRGKVRKRTAVSCGLNRAAAIG